MKPNKNLIFDIGMHICEDTEYYLKKGYKVVAVEANPKLCKDAEKKFKKQISKGQLIIKNACISDKAGKMDFFVNKGLSEWSSFNERIASRRFGSDKINVDALPVPELFEEYGIPYYMKIDIEGADGLPVLGLFRTNIRPVYVSYEASSIDPVAHLYTLGYKRLALVRQRAVPNTCLPKPALEGKYCNHTFPLGSSGAFGQEINGNWGNLEECIRDYVAFKYLNCNIPGVGNDWADIHAYNYKAAKDFSLI